MKAKHILVIACTLGALSVMIGAFGAHALKDILTHNGRLDTFETGVKYQFYHTLAIFGIALVIQQFPNRFFYYAAYLMFAGIIIFSGSLYILSITGMTFLGAVAPIGGLSFIAGWISALTGVIKTH